MELINDQLPEGLKPINIRGARLAYRETGTGPPLVLVHANLSDIRTWDALVPCLAKHFKVITYCRRYHWPLESIADNVADPWEEQAEDLAALIDALSIGPATLMGNSSGSTLTLLVARNYPDRVRSLILEEPPAITIFLPRTPPAVLDVLKLLVWHPWYFFPLVYFGATVVDPTEKNFKRNEVKAAVDIFLRGVLGEETFKALSSERWEQVVANTKPHQALFCYGSFLPSFTEEDAKSIVVPTLVLEAEKSVPAHQCVNSQLAILMSGAEKAVIKGVGHFMHEDDAAQVSARIVEWYRF